MTRTVGLLLACGIGLGPLSVAAAQTAPAQVAEKPVKEPFYRRYLVSGNALDDKIREQEKLLEASPQSASLHNDFGNLLALRRFPKEAREHYEIAMKLDKKGYLAPYNLGLVFETEGKISQAIRAYEKCVDRNRGFPPGLFRLGHLYEKRGWNGRAVRAYAKALHIDPEMRNPARNPLVVDTLLLDRASLISYEQDLATSSLSFDAHYADQARFRRIPYDRAIYSEELDETLSKSPAVVNPSETPAKAPASLPATAGQTRPQALAPGPGANAAPPPTPTRPGTRGRAPVPPGMPAFAPTPAPSLITPVPPPPTPEQ